ncbi:MAG: hypothetical protein QNJ54_25130 [Prochloraceae cyanobacterium]|nr:hypothetical protein [Prochloraceae cyanobacterium]
MSSPDIETQPQQQAHDEAKRNKQGEETERYVIKLLKPLCGRGGQLFSSLDDKRLFTPNRGKLDILMNLSGVRFAVSVKSNHNEKVKVFYDRKHESIRYSTKKWGKGRFLFDITQQINDQVDWLLANRPKLFSKKKQPKMPWRIIVVCGAPAFQFQNQVEVVVFPDSPTESINDTEYLKDRGVYVVDQRSLVSLIQALKNKPNEEYVSN